MSKLNMRCQTLARGQLHNKKTATRQIGIGVYGTQNNAAQTLQYP